VSSVEPASGPASEHEREPEGEPASRPPAVVLASGHLVDAPDRPSPRFPPGEVARVSAEIAATLDRWAVDERTTVVSGGARGADLLVAEQARARGARVVLCLALPPEEFDRRSVALAGSDWSQRFAALLEVADVRVLERDPGARPPGDEVFARTNAWMVELARSLGGDPPHAIIVWDGQAGDGPGGTRDLLQRLGLDETSHALVIIDPRPGPAAD
jgi:hypothetical protein